MFVLCAILFFVTGLVATIARSLAVVVLLLVALGVYWARKKKKTSRPPGTKRLVGSPLLNTNFTSRVSFSNVLFCSDMPLSSMAEEDVAYVNFSGATGRAGGERGGARGGRGGSRPRAEVAV